MGSIHAGISVAIRCALAIAVRVMVLAGTLGKTLESTMWIRRQPPGVPNMSVSNSLGDDVIGKDPPV
jgi:hypothetical protein